MIKKKILFLSFIPFITLPLVVSCAQDKKVESFKDEKGKDFSFETNINFSLEEIQSANLLEEKDDLAVGNFLTINSSIELDYTINGGNDADFFKIDNQENGKVIYLKNSKFKEIIDLKKETFNFDIKVKYKNEYIIKTINFALDTKIETWKTNLGNDEEQKNKPANLLKIRDTFDVKVALEPNTTGAIKNFNSHPIRVNLIGAFDAMTQTFYTPIEYSETEKNDRERLGFPTKPEIIFTAKNKGGIFVSWLEAYLLHSKNNIENESIIGVTYEKMDGTIKEVENIKDTRVDLETLRTDPKEHERTMRYIPINEKVRKIVFTFKEKDVRGLYPYVSEIIFRGEVKTNYTQEGSNYLSDRNFATYLESNPLSKKNNVRLIKNNKVVFNFDTEKPTKLKQIQIYKAPVGYTNNSQPYPEWKTRKNIVTKYKYLIDFVDGTKTILEIYGWEAEKESINIPEKYHDKVVKTVTLIADNILELKEVVFV